MGFSARAGSRAGHEDHLIFEGIKLKKKIPCVMDPNHF
jgi:hypothetical protein